MSSSCIMEMVFNTSRIGRCRIAFTMSSVRHTALALLMPHAILRSAGAVLSGLSECQYSHGGDDTIWCLCCAASVELDRAVVSASELRCWWLR